MHSTTTQRRHAALGACLLAGVLLACGVVLADDRDLLRNAGANPYVFVVFDTSTSMASTAPCSYEQALTDMDPFDAMCTSECTLGATLCARLCPNQGCREYDFSGGDPPDPSTVPDIILDNDAGSAVTFTGSWGTDTTPVGFHGGNYRHDEDTGDADPRDPRTATYDPGALVAGDYMVFLKWPSDGAFASNTLVDVERDGGTSTVAVDQRNDGGKWNAIGTFSITSSTGIVTIRNERTSGKVIADAVGWHPVTIPACDGATVYRCQQPVCPLGDCYTPLNGDDPNSKLFQAKQALYEVIEGVPTVQFGFDTFEQDRPHLGWKHWLYRIAPGQSLPQLGGPDFLGAGVEEVFGNYSLPGFPNPPHPDDPPFETGDGWNCMSLEDSAFTAPEHRTGCEPANPSDLDDPWEVTRARRIPKLGRGGGLTTEAWYRAVHDDAHIYKLVYNPAAAATSLGAGAISVDYQVLECPGGVSCGAPGPCDFNGICEVTDGENCQNCPSDCRAKTSPAKCCGLNAGESPGVNPNGCGGATSLCHKAGFSCTATAAGRPWTGTIDYDLVTDYVARDLGIGRQPMEGGGFFHEQANFKANDTCQGLDPNDDSTPVPLLPRQADVFNDYNLRWPTNPDPSLSPLLDVGDFVPVDWRNAHRDTILQRLAPNTAAGGSPPDFRSAAYFSSTLHMDDDPLPPDRLLRLADSLQRPIIAGGDTPLGESLFDFLEWWNPSDVAETGFVDVAAAGDQFFTCRDRYLLMLTDGLEACYNQRCKDETSPTLFFCQVFGPGLFDHDPVAYATQLWDEEIQVNVLGFGIPGGEGSSLQSIATAGNGDLFLPQNKDELVADLTQIISEIQAETKTFAAASIPAVQSSSTDKIFLSSFVPLPGQSFWAGRVDAFRKPLPLTPEGEPDVARGCVANSLEAACHVWEAGKKLCDQAPDETEVIAGNFKLGTDAANTERTQRRVLYGKQSLVTPPATRPTVPNALRLFDVPDLPAMDPPVGDPNPALGTDAVDLANGLDPSGDQVAAYQANSIPPSQMALFFEHILGETLKIKPLDLAFDDEVDACNLPLGGEGYILGDVFHGSPIAIGSPGDFTYFDNNTSNYRDFARKNVWRRRMLATPTNDGQLHFFDAGIRRLVPNTFTPDPNDKIEVMTDGLGHELFSYIPRFALPILAEQVDSTKHIYSVDSTVATGDVYIDPKEDGTDHTQWRTVVVGGVREAGDIFEVPIGVPYFKGGYFALDVTQPDFMDTRGDASDPSLVPCPPGALSCDEDTPTPQDEYVPTCLALVAASGNQAAGPCPFPFPIELWTFRDSVEVPGYGTFFLDEDVNQGLDLKPIPDLAEAWSKPVIGQILACSVQGGNCDPDADPVLDPTGDDDLVAVQVAIFGGGMDAKRKGEPEVGGNFLYMVDVETGEAIYKRELDGSGTGDSDAGSAVGDPAVLDLDRDGFFDVIYIGTTAGELFKVNLGPDSSSQVPGFDDPGFAPSADQLVQLDAAGDATRFSDLPGNPPLPAMTRLRRISGPVVDAMTGFRAWDPFLLLDTGDPNSMTPRRGSPIYHAPAAFFIPTLDNAVGLAFGTGDRENLWDYPNGEDVVAPAEPFGGRFFVIVDDGIEYDRTLYDLAATPGCDSRLPIEEACIHSFAFDTAPDLSANYLDDPAAGDRAGWVMRIKTDDVTITEEVGQSRITNEAFLVAGILVFSSFDPTVTPVGGNACQQSGLTRSFVVRIDNGGPVTFLGGDPDNDPGTPLPDTPPDRAIDRFHEIGEFTTAPFVDTTATQNPDATGQTLLDEIDDELSDAVRDALISQFPRGSRFNKAFRLVIGALRNSTGVNVYTTIPIAIYPADWRDQ